MYLRIIFSDEVAKIAIKEERGNNNEESNHNQAK